MHGCVLLVAPSPGGSCREAVLAFLYPMGRSVHESRPDSPEPTELFSLASCGRSARARSLESPKRLRDGLPRDLVNPEILKQRSLFGPEGRATATQPGPDEGVWIRGPIFRCGTVCPPPGSLLAGAERFITEHDDEKTKVRGLVFGSESVSRRVAFPRRAVDGTRESP